MTNHVHLIINPRNEPKNLSRLMKLLSGSYTQYFNSINNSKGTLWEGRFRSDPIEDESYLLVCSRYIELNPVRAGMVKVPENYLWSSYRQKIGLETKDWLDLDPCYMALGNKEQERQYGYKSWVKKTLGSDPGQTPGF
jgi:putative transposase